MYMTIPKQQNQSGCVYSIWPAIYTLGSEEKMEQYGMVAYIDTISSWSFSFQRWPLDMESKHNSWVRGVIWSQGYRCHNPRWVLSYRTDLPYLGKMNYRAQFRCSVLHLWEVKDCNIFNTNASKLHFFCSNFFSIWYQNFTANSKWYRYSLSRSSWHFNTKD